MPDKIAAATAHSYLSFETDVKFVYHAIFAGVSTSPDKRLNFLLEGTP
jgi:hypothetical protein